MNLRLLRHSNSLKTVHSFNFSALKSIECSRVSRHRYSSASEKLFKDAAREEAESKSQPKRPSHLTFLENEHQNWDGEERIQDAVLRMLVDKYKPLRTGTIQLADQKLKLTPPRVSRVVVTPTEPLTGSWANEPLLPSKADHQPWHTKFKVPNHATASIKHASFLPLPVRNGTAKSQPVNDRARRKEREEKRKIERAVRLSKARETTLDYRLGIRGSGGSGDSRAPAQISPVSLKGWASLVEDKIEKARKAGLFNTVKGRGKPLVASVEESNPFIAREEFLMNRIVQRNGAAPPWVEIQGELDTAVETFREILLQSWTRRVVRNITTSTPPALLHTFTLSDIKAFRDLEWERREHAYHRAAIEELNGLVRKYNGIAPYAVRRPYYTQNVELEKVFDGSAEGILERLTERVQKRDVERRMDSSSLLEHTTRKGGSNDVHAWSLWLFLKPWLEAIFSEFWRSHKGS